MSKIYRANFHGDVEFPGDNSFINIFDYDYLNASHPHSPKLLLSVPFPTQEESAEPGLAGFLWASNLQSEVPYLEPEDHQPLQNAPILSSRISEERSSTFHEVIHEEINDLSADSLRKDSSSQQYPGGAEDQEAERQDFQLKKQRLSPKILRPTNLAQLGPEETVVTEQVRLLERLKKAMRIFEPAFYAAIARKNRLFAQPIEFDSEDEQTGEEALTLLKKKIKPETRQVSADFDQNWPTEEDKAHYLRMVIKVRELESRVIAYMHMKQRQGSNGKERHICRICSAEFPTGRQLGGHMSRKHPGSSENFRLKKLVHQSKILERTRREYFKSLKKEEYIEPSPEDQEPRTNLSSAVPKTRGISKQKLKRKISMSSLCQEKPKQDCQETIKKRGRMVKIHRKPKACEDDLDTK